MNWVKDKMYQARLQRYQIQAQGVVATQVDNLSQDPKKANTRLSYFSALTHKLAWLAGGMAVVGMIVFLVWEPELPDGGGGSRTISLSDDKPEQHHTLLEKPSQYSTTDNEDLRKDIILLTEQMQTLTTSIADLKTEILRIHAVTDSIAALGNELVSDVSRQDVIVSDIVTQVETLPAPAADMANVGHSNSKNAEKLANVTSTRPVAMREITQPTSKQQAQEVIPVDGHWAINLASLPNKADAERFMAVAQSKGVATDLYLATVKGKNYWRVHVPGFATADEANANAIQIKEKLGLKSVWVAKR